VGIDVTSRASTDATAELGRMHPLSLRFEDPELESAFVDEQARRARRPLRIMFVCAIVIISAAWVLAQVLGEPTPRARVTTTVGLAAFVLVTALAYALSYTRTFLQHHQMITLVLMCGYPAGLIRMEPVVQPAKFLLPSILVLVVLHIFNVYSNVRLRFPMGTVAGWVTAATYVSYVATVSSWGLPALVTVGFLLVATNVFGMLSSYQMELYLRREFAALRQRERAELEARRARDQAEAATQAKSDFLASMSHELRTPLNAIIGFSEVLDERMFGELNDKQAEYIRDIHGSGKHLLSLINDVLDLSKVEAGRMELDVTTFDLPSTLDAVLTLVRERAARHGISLGVDVDGGLGAFGGDERKFKQIMLNLLSNAVKFTPEGGRIDVTARPRGALVEVAVADTGTGIAAVDLPRVFEEFRQVGTDTARKAEGTGLGLTLTKRFVELHGGTIRVDSAPGKGSTFTFTLAEHA